MLQCLLENLAGALLAGELFGYSSAVSSYQRLYWCVCTLSITPKLNILILQAGLAVFKDDFAQQRADSSSFIPT